MIIINKKWMSNAKEKKRKEMKMVGYNKGKEMQNQNNEATETFTGK